MTVTLEIRVRDLLPEFLADALILLTAFQATGAIPAGPLQTVLHHLDDFLILIQSDCHGAYSFSFYYNVAVKGADSLFFSLSFLAKE